ALHVLRQRAIGEAELVNEILFFHDIDNAAGVQRPQPKSIPQDRDDLSHRQRCLRPAKLHPAELEHLPAAQGSARRGKGRFSFPQLNTVMIQVVAGRWCPSRGPDIRIRKRLLPLASQESVNRFLGWLADKQHDWVYPSAE